MSTYAPFALSTLPPVVKLIREMAGEGDGAHFIAYIRSLIGGDKTAFMHLIDRVLGQYAKALEKVKTYQTFATAPPPMEATIRSGFSKAILIACANNKDYKSEVIKKIVHLKLNVSEPNDLSWSNSTVKQWLNPLLLYACEVDVNTPIIEAQPAKFIPMTYMDKGIVLAKGYDAKYLEYFKRFYNNPGKTNLGVMLDILFYKWAVYTYPQGHRALFYGKGEARDRFKPLNNMGCPLGSVPTGALVSKADGAISTLFF